VIDALIQTLLFSPTGLHFSQVKVLSIPLHLLVLEFVWQLWEIVHIYIYIYISFAKYGFYGFMFFMFSWMYSNLCLEEAYMLVCYLIDKIGLDSTGGKYNLLLHLIMQCGRLSVFHSVKLLFVHWVHTCGLLCPLQLRWMPNEKCDQFRSGLLSNKSLALYFTKECSAENVIKNFGLPMLSRNCILTLYFFSDLAKLMSGIAWTILSRISSLHNNCCCEPTHFVYYHCCHQRNCELFNLHAFFCYRGTDNELKIWGLCVVPPTSPSWNTESPNQHQTHRSVKRMKSAR